MLLPLFAFLIGAILVRLLHSAEVVNVPPNPCQNKFDYKVENGRYYGIIKLPFPNVFEVNVRFSLHGPVPLSYSFLLEDYKDEKFNGNYTLYRVNFPSLDELPRLTRIAINDRELCSGNGCDCASIDVVRSRESSYQKITQFTATSQVCVVCPTTPGADVPQAVPLLNGLLTCGQDRSAVTPFMRGGHIMKPFIRGGQTLERGQFPWLVAIYRKVQGGLKVFCGGSLVSTRTIISAAHCFVLLQLDASDIVVYLGRNNLMDHSEDGVVVREVQTLIIHPDYDRKVRVHPDSDLAILHMKTPVSFTEYIQPVCLWEESEAKTGFVAGWGNDGNGNKVSPMPKVAKAEIVSESKCLRSLGHFELTSNRTVCAGNRDDTGPCMGDSGGGLMIMHDGRWMLRGIVSAGQESNQQCYLRQYVIYCDVAKHMTWVSKNTID